MAINGIHLDTSAYIWSLRGKYMDDQSAFLKVGEVAKLIGVSRGRAYQMIKDDKLPGIRLSTRRVRVPRVALEAWLSVQIDRALARVTNAALREDTDE
jgi:excisionase family DNA binding protein